MLRRLLLLLVSLSCGACAGAQLCPQRHALVRQPAMSCAELNQVTAAAVKRLGYNINNFQVASNEQPGKLEGSKRDDYDSTYYITVELRCSSTEALADAVSTIGCGGQISFPSDFQQSFNISMAKKIERPSIVPKEQQAGLRIEVEPQRQADTALGVPLAAADLMSVKVTINNRTARAYRLEDGGITLVAENGKPVQAVSAAEAAKRVAQAQPAQAGGAEAKLREKGLQAGGIAANGRVEGYLYVPRQAYRRATVRLVDEEADEPEGFTIEF